VYQFLTLKIKKFLNLSLINLLCMVAYRMDIIKIIFFSFSNDFSLNPNSVNIPHAYSYKFKMVFYYQY